MIDWKNKTCEEASIISKNNYIPCGKLAKYLVKNKDPKPYFMCDFCAHHNVKNRGAEIIDKELNAFEIIK